MPSRRAITTVTGLVVVWSSGVILGCGADGPSRDAVVAGAVDAGFSEDLAVCFVDGLYDELGPERVEELLADPAAVEALSEDEARLYDQVSADCLDADELVENPDVSIDE